MAANVHRLRRRRMRRGVVAAAAVALATAIAPPHGLASASPRTPCAHPGVGTPMPRIEIRAGRLYAGKTPWRAWGMNWGIADHEPVIAYLDHPTPANLAVLACELRTAHRLGANTMRVYVELGQVMQSPTTARPSTLAALRTLLDIAEREHVYLDITGNLVWRPALAAAWYDRLGEQARWQVQANFWRAVARTAAGSPAVLCYELTSEPVISDAPGWYTGELGGWYFVQVIAHPHGRSPRTLARAWTKLLAAAVRSQDNRPVTIGMLPLTTGGFAPANVADLLDMLVVHKYPTAGKAAQAVALVRQYASIKRPVLLGETFLLFSDLPTQRSFLLGANRYLVGVLEFFNGRDPSNMRATSISDALYQTGMRQFVALRPLLLKPQ